MNCIIFYPLHIHISQTFTLNLLSLESRRSSSFFIPQKREPSLKSLFHSQHQHSQWLTSAVWEPSFSAFLGEIRQPLGQTALLDTVASNKVIFNGICLLGRTGFQTDRKLHRSKDCIWRASKSQIVLRNPVLIYEVPSRGTTGIVLYKHYILRSEGEIFFMYSFHILSSLTKALWWLRYPPSADRRSQSDQSQKTLHSSSSLAPFSSVRCNTTSTKTTAAERFSQQELARCLHIDHLQVKQNSEGIAVFWPPPLQ